MREASTPLPEDSAIPGLANQEEIYGMLGDLDQLEELLEDLDDLGLTTRSGVDLSLINARKHVGDREADALISRLEDVLTAMDEFEVASRDDIVSKMTGMDAEVEAIRDGEDSLDS
jgi:hypothetical protein